LTTRDFKNAELFDIGEAMSKIKMAEIRLPIMDRLVQAGYLPVKRGRYVRWSRGRYDNVWFTKQVIQANSNKTGSAIVRTIASEPDGSVPEDRQGMQDVWYTDGYQGRRSYSDLISLLKAMMIRFAGLRNYR
jgi:hypothetical protein